MNGYSYWYKFLFKILQKKYKILLFVGLSFPFFFFFFFFILQQIYIFYNIRMLFLYFKNIY